MQWQFIVALVVAIPIVLFPVAYLWYINVGGLYAAIQQRRERRAARREMVRTAVGEEGAKKDLVGTRK
jgi:uncharacterized paraquat-inducible protein A